MPLDIELLEQSFERIKPRADEFAASFYENLFAASPEVKPMFAKTDMSKQQKKLLNALILVVENLRNPDALGEVLSALGSRHVAYGTTPVQYTAVGEILLQTFEQYLQQEWTLEVKQAWVDAYTAIAAQMLKGAGAEYSPEPVQLETGGTSEKQVADARVAPAKAETDSQSSELAADLLVSSFEKIKPRANEFAASFYDNLFAAHPEVKPLFGKTEMASQQKKLLNSLVLVVENIRNPVALGEVLTALGARHVGYGAIPKYYAPVGEALLATFEQYLQEDWTPEVKKAWLNAFRGISALMLKGAGKASSTEPLQNAKVSNLENPPQAKPDLTHQFSSLNRQAKREKKAGSSINKAGEILKEIIEQKKRGDRLLIHPQELVQQGKATLKRIFSQLLAYFWNLPTWLVTTVSTVLFAILLLCTPDNSLLSKLVKSSSTISFFVALVLFIKEAPDRRRQFHYQAWGTVDAAHNAKVSYARIFALQDLNADGVSLRGLDAPEAELVAINLPKANLSEANLKGSNLSNANLSYTNLDNANISQAKLVSANLTHAKLGFARLSKTNLSSANLSYANLVCADLSHANLSGANLKNASLSGANLEGAYLTGANLKDAQVSTFELSSAYLEGAIMPDGSKYQAVKN